MQTLELIKIGLGVNGSENNSIRLPNLKRERLALLFSELGFDRGVEIGVHKGYFSETLCKANPALLLVSVDIWQRPQIYDEAIERLKAYRCLPLRTESVKAASMFADGFFDFVYIDGDHEYNSVMADIKAWQPKVRVGGIVSGHDYRVSRETATAARCEVVKAVDEYVHQHCIDPLFVIGESLRAWPSWFWVKK